MRRWLAVLVFVPGLAWGECYSVEMRESYLGLALDTMDAKERGASERELLSLVLEKISDPGDKAAAMEAVRVVYSPIEPGPSSIVTAMQNACYQEVSR